MNISELEKNNDILFKDIKSQLDSIIDTVKNINDTLYESKVNSMSEEELGYEYADRIGDELDEFSHLKLHYGIEFIKDRLIDNYVSNSFERRKV